MHEARRSPTRRTRPGTCTPDARSDSLGDRPPDLPRQRERPGSQTRGDFVSSVREGSTCSARVREDHIGSAAYQATSALKHPGARCCAPEAGARLNQAHVRHVVMLRRERREAGFATHKAQCACKDLPVAGGCGTSIERYSGTACDAVRCARRCRGVCRSERCSRGRKLRGRAAAKAVGHRFDPVRPPLDSSNSVRTSDC